MALTVDARWIAVALGLLAGLLPRDAAAQASNPNVLWQIVHGQCIPDEQQHGDPKPCAEVNLASGFAVLKDIKGASQFLLIPTTEVGGIEDPLLLAPFARNYFASSSWTTAPTKRTVTGGAARNCRITAARWR